MKNLSFPSSHLGHFFLFPFLLLLLSSPAIAQKNNFKMAYIPWEKFYFGQEIALNPNLSLLFHLQIYRLNYNRFSLTWPINRSVYTNNGFRMGLESRFYHPKFKKNLNGPYVAPNFSIGKQTIHYSYPSSTGSSSTFPYPSSFSNSVGGKEKLTIVGIGSKFGIQKRWDFFNIDLSLNIIRNFVVGDLKALPLSNGEQKAFPVDISGISADLSFGIGFAF